MITHRSFQKMFEATQLAFLTQSEEVHTARWQGMDVSKRPDMVSHELLNWNCNLSLDWLTRLRYGDGTWSHPDLLMELAGIVGPNVPWADDHFLERVGGEPLNPGVQWANWPWASSADKHRTNERFNHTYMERLWPKWARMTPGGKLRLKKLGAPHKGIALKYGDLEDLVQLLAYEPDTRQAWIPLFFPEDTGIGDGGRKPCTLGYQIIVRNKQASIFYPLRSCDFIRHFRDDIYMAIRLLLWVMDECCKINPAFWDEVTPGYYAMHCTSLHVFANDFAAMKR